MTDVIKQASSYEDIDQIQTNAIREHAKRIGRPLSILEAGCGLRWTFDLTGIEYTLTGVDIDPVALELRKTTMRDLNVAIVGDLCTVNLPDASFDVVYSAFVLEHIPHADIALQNLTRWLRDDGLLILRLPERQSARGFVTRMLPHRVHVLYYRYALGAKTAGQPGHAPFPTHYHPIIGRQELCRFLSDHNLNCIGIYGDGFRREGSGLTRILASVVVKLVSICSFGKLTSDYADLLYITVKEPIRVEDNLLKRFE